jgi:hypothetical protein
MTLRAPLARRLAFGLWGLGALAYFDRAQAQASTAVAPAVPTTWSGANLPGTAVFQDRYIAGGSLAPDITTGEEPEGDGAGLARSLQIDGVVSALSSHDGSASNDVEENGLVVKSQWETQGYGAWSIDGSVRTGGSDLGPSEQGQGGVIALRERGMPFDGDWQADNGLGDINTADIGLARFQPRFYLPTSPMQGASTEWRGPDGLQIVAGGGVPGLYDGIEVPNFRTLGGSVATAGAQWSPSSNWTVGGQLVDARDVNLAIGSIVDGAAPLSSTTGLLTAAWQDHGEHLQFNLLDGDASGNPNALGTWVDGSITQGRFQQSAGLFRIDPNMTWGNQLISDDMQGGYYRLDYQSRQWQADAGVDEVRSVSGLGSDTTFLTGDTRYQLSRDWGVGTIADISRTDDANGWSLEGYLDHLNAYGTSRAQAEFASTPSGRDATLTLNQAWSTPVGIRLSTSGYLEHIDGAVVDELGEDSTLVGLAATGGGQFTSRLGLEGNVQWARAVPGVSTNVSLTYQLMRNWQILGTYYDSRTGSWTPLAVTSPLAPPVPTAVPAVDERGVFLTLRYKRDSGSHFAPLGGGPGSGAGEIVGTVYLDANDNGRLDAGEAGAPNVTVVLDGRFSAQTDANGRFDFPVVAAGHHVLTVISDNLPLPWSLPNAGRNEIDVATRGRAEVSIGAQRAR